MIRCNLCGFPVVSIYKGVFGKRCLRCASTFIHRAIGLVLQEMEFKEDIRVYELSSSGALFKFLKKRYKRLIYSEFYDNVVPGDFRKGIQCQDVQQLTYQDEIFDLITSTEVFEHVPDDSKGFKEIFRVLKKGGYFIFTVPLSDTEKTIERTFIRNGEIIHVLPPEYHGDRIRGIRNVLAFRNYGMDIREKLQSAGFKVNIRIINNDRHAISNGRVIICNKE
jgi:SAM-dependent methyltransferase